MPKTVAFCTLGCKVNQYDSQAMLEQFERAGYVSAPFSAQADVYVINTCTVTGTGDQKSRQMIRRARAKNPKAAIVVAGCMAQRVAEALLLPGVRLVIGTQRRMEVVGLLEKSMAREAPLIAVEPLGGAAFESLTIRGSEGKTRATLKIQEGCENHCAYCIIPSVRGPVRSRPVGEIRTEAERLVDAGFLEIVVTGIHLASYGKDFADGTRLEDALEAITSVRGIHRVRLGSLEPGIVTEPFTQALLVLPGLCPQFMLALQSGSDSVLARMGRRYNTAQYAKAAERLRGAFPRVALTTDIMVGFPGETESEFLETLAFVEKMRFARIHVFPFSSREGTRANSMPNQVPKAVREERAARLIALGDRMAADYLAGWLGETGEVLFESVCRECAGDSKRLAEGYTPEYIRVRGEGVPGEIKRVLFDTILGECIVGKLL